MKTRNKLDHMLAGGKILRGALQLITANIKPGVNGVHLNKIAEEYLYSHNASPSFKGYRGYPTGLCISINNVVVHGIPSATSLRTGDVVGLDLGVFYYGYHTDSAITVIVTDDGCDTVDKLISKSKRSDYLDLSTKERLLCICYNALNIGIKQARVGNKTGDIGEEIQKYSETHGFSVIRDLVGHGIGTSIHEDPNVPNFGKRNTGAILKDGLAIAIEPMLTMGDWHVFIGKDNWSILTVDNSLSAHFEHTIFITNGDAIVVT